MIQRFADWLVCGVFGMSAGTHAGNAVDFFVYDSVKILLLLFSISLIMGVVNAYFPIDRLRRCRPEIVRVSISPRLVVRGGHAVLLRSSIPLFIRVRQGRRIRLGVTLAYF